jgi:hypothetical protein
VIALVKVNVPPEASIVPELAKVVTVTVPMPATVEPAAFVSDPLDPLDLSVPPPSWITPLLRLVKAVGPMVAVSPLATSIAPLLVNVVGEMVRVLPLASIVPLLAKVFPLIVRELEPVWLMTP